MYVRGYQHDSNCTVANRNSIIPSLKVIVPDAVTVTDRFFYLIKAFYLDSNLLPDLPAPATTTHGIQMYSAYVRMYIRTVPVPFIPQ